MVLDEITWEVTVNRKKKTSKDLCSGALQSLEGGEKRRIQKGILRRSNQKNKMEVRKE